MFDYRPVLTPIPTFEQESKFMPSLLFQIGFPVPSPNFISCLAQCEMKF